MTVELPSFWRRWLPQSITAQILLLALAGLILAQVLGLQIYRSERDEALGLVNSRNAMIISPLWCVCSAARRPSCMKKFCAPAAVKR